MNLRTMNLRNINLDRRQKLRIVPNELVFLQLERDDGGTVLDVSEGGLGFETFAPVSPNGPVHFWFSLNLRDRIEAWGEVIWTNASRKCGGLRFLRLSEEARAQIRRWMAEFSTRQAVGAESARRNAPESRPDKFGRGKFDAVAAFVSKARPRHSTLFGGVEAGSVETSASTDIPETTFQEQAAQPQHSELVPVQKYVAEKRKQLIFGLVLGICISSMVAIAAVKFSNYLRQNPSPQKVAAEARTVKPEPELKQPAAGLSAVIPPAAPAATNASSADIFSGSNQKKTSSSGQVMNPQLATATSPVRSGATEPAKLAAASPPLAIQTHSREIASKSQPSGTPEQLWASVQAGNSKAALELAELYIQGNGVPQNCTQARVLLMVASEKRNAGAIKRLQELDKAGCPGE
jgi:PilZ domain-containing protein